MLSQHVATSSTETLSELSKQIQLLDIEHLANPHFVRQTRYLFRVALIELTANLTDSALMLIVNNGYSYPRLIEELIENIQQLDMVVCRASIRASIYLKVPPKLLIRLNTISNVSLRILADLHKL